MNQIERQAFELILALEALPASAQAGLATAMAKTLLTSIQTQSTRLSFSELKEINLQRANRWHRNGGIEEWNEAEWSNAMAGEAGEACNATKKLRRIICGMQQSDGDSAAPKSLDEARLKVLKEVGDTVIYGDLLCQRVHGSLEQAVVMAFNQVSAREGFPERL